MRPLILLLALLAACGEKEPVDTGAVTDADADGYPEDVDCDDQDASIHPDAAETCNRVDDDCDGDVDEEVLEALFTDADGDGYGDAAAPVEGCEEPGLVRDDSDCDDGDPLVNPGATEVCDGDDEDCDSLVDDEDDSLDLATATTWYRDLDSDGWGNAEDTVLACEKPLGAVAQSGDCDDVRNGVNPDAEEACDGIDTDCDGVLSPDEEDADGDGQRGCDGDCDDETDTVYLGADELCDSLDNDCDGSPMPEESDDDGDGYVECTPDGWAGQPIDGGDDCDDADADAWPGADEYCDGHDDDCDGDVDEDDALDASTWYADLDGDGYGDPNSSEVDCYQPSNTVSDDTDCDDGNAKRNPGLTEICDGFDNDCDANTSEDGMVTLVDGNGGITDLSSSFGTSSPTTVTLATAGEVTFCDGTYYAHVDLQADLTLSSQSGVAGDVLLDGGEAGTVLSTSTGGLSVQVNDLTLQNGSADSGGLVACQATSTLDLEGVSLQGGYALEGGAVYNDGCTVTLTDCELSDNEAVSGGAVLAESGTVTLDSCDVHDNLADMGAALTVYAASGDATVSIDETRLYDNLADYGAVLVQSDGHDALFECSGSSTTSAGFTDNTDTLGAVLLVDSGASASLSTCDTGSSSGGDDNDPADIYTVLGNQLSLGDDEDLECSEGGCNLGLFETSGTTSSGSGTNRARGVVVLSQSTALLDSVGFYTTGSCTVDFYVLQAAQVSGPWNEVSKTTLTSTNGWNDLTLELPTSAGEYYAFVYGWEICSLTWYEDTSASDFGWGIPAGYASTSTYGGQLDGLSLGSASTAPQMRFDVWL